MNKVLAEKTGCVKGVCSTTNSYGSKSYGTWVYDDGDTYVGDWAYGQRDGIGVYTFSSGTTIEGIWSRGEIEIQCMEGNCINGKGLINNKSNGHVYFGDLKNYIPNGEGLLTVPNGNKYSGGFKDNKLYGMGTYVWSDGSKYIGGWKNDQMHGKGTIIYEDGVKSIGEFIEGNRKDGIHTRIFLDGSELKILYKWNEVEEYEFENESKKQKWLEKLSKKNKIKENVELKCIDVEDEVIVLKLDKKNNRIILDLNGTTNYFKNQNIDLNVYLNYILTNNDRIIIAAGSKSFNVDGEIRSRIFRIELDKYTGDFSVTSDELDEKGFQYIKTLNADSYNFRRYKGKANCKKRILN